jgi:hypothetical protein
MIRCKSNHSHAGALSARICDAELAQRVRNDRAARPAQYQPIKVGEPTIAPAPRWLKAAGKDLTGNVRSN